MKSLSKIPLYLVAAILLVVSGYPFVYMISTALKTQGEFFEQPFSLFTSFTLENFTNVFQLGLTSYFVNSVIVTVVAVGAVVIIGSLASYPISRMKFKFNRVLFLLFISGMMLPIHATLIPIFKLSESMGIYDTLYALMGPYIAFS